MNNGRKKWLHKIAKVFYEYKQKNQFGMPIVVEGLRDKKLLLDLGYIGPIEILNRGWSLEKFTTYLIEKYDDSKISNISPLSSVLMDWDRTGEELQKKLVHMITSMDKVVDESLRLELIKALNGRTKTVEGIRFIIDELLELMSTFIGER
tara:strand:- start:4025 stop:4474 length:450 start_codon:yes stop_codon:yes gene_type:complete